MSPRAIVIRYHKLGSFKQQEFILPQIWRLEVQRVGRAMFPLKPEGENPSLPLPSFWWFAGKLWCSLTCSFSISICVPSSYSVVPLCVYILSLLMTPVILDQSIL